MRSSTRSSRRVLSAALLLAPLAVLTACDHHSNPLSAEDAQALVATASDMSVASVIDGLQVEPSQRPDVEAKLNALHDVMLELHAAHPQDLDGLSEAEKEALHAELQSGMDAVHEHLQAFMASLTDEQQQRFQEHVHAAMQSHHDGAGDLHSEHLDSAHDGH